MNTLPSRDEEEDVEFMEELSDSENDDDSAYQEEDVPFDYESGEENVVVEETVDEGDRLNQHAIHVCDH